MIYITTNGIQSSITKPANPLCSGWFIMLIVSIVLKSRRESEIACSDSSSAESFSQKLHKPLIAVSCLSQDVLLSLWVQ